MKLLAGSILVLVGAFASAETLFPMPSVPDVTDGDGWTIDLGAGLEYDDDYSQTIIGRNKRDYAWIMALTPTISREDFFERVELLREQGYDTDKLKVVPQRWEDTESNYSFSLGHTVTP